jgi:hypothetical protein
VRYPGALAAEQLTGGLWRWTASHSEWEPTDAAGEPRSWPREVGCVLWVGDDDAAFIDALVPADDPAFWTWTDRCCAGRAVAVLETIAFHRRDRDTFAARYKASSDPPGDVVAHPLEIVGETLYWLPGPRALIPGDTLVGAGGGELSLCPPSWLEELGTRPTPAQLREALRELLALAPEMVLVSHGEPARSDAAAALARALDAA